MALLVSEVQAINISAKETLGVSMQRFISVDMKAMLLETEPAIAMMSIFPPRRIFNSRSNLQRKIGRARVHRVAGRLQQ